MFYASLETMIHAKHEPIPEFSVMRHHEMWHKKAEQNEAITMSIQTSYDVSQDDRLLMPPVYKLFLPTSHMQI